MIKLKKLVKLTGNTGAMNGVRVKNSIATATNGHAYAEVPFEETGEEKLDGVFKKGYFAQDIELVHDGEILYKTELKVEPVAQTEIEYPDTRNLLLMENEYPAYRLDLKVLQRLIDVFKEQKDTEVDIHISGLDKPMLLVGKTVRGCVMGLKVKP